jgi:hypothetical protein
VLLLLATLKTPPVIIDGIHASAKRYTKESGFFTVHTPNPIHCNHKTNVNYIPSELTLRPLEDYLRYQAPFLSFLHTLDLKSGGSVLEIGSGSGRALLDLKAAYPATKVYGTNLR